MPSFLSHLLVYNEDGHYIEILRKVRNTLEKVVWLENDQKPKVVDERISYCIWVIKRVKEVRLPLKPIVDQSINEGPSQDVESDEVK